MEHSHKIFKKKSLINCGGYLLDISHPLVMGIMNITPDSFYAHSRLQNEHAVVERAHQILEQGGAMIDIGGYSSRPHAQHVSEEEEIQRLRPVVAIVRKEFPKAFLSIDTFRSGVVKTLFDEFGAFIVNDISAGELDKQMIGLVGKLQLPYIAMHMQGTPQDMQKNPHYADIIQEQIRFFTLKYQALQAAGIHDIILDPGFGFGKTQTHNYELLNRLDEFKIFNLPLLVGVSRKSMLYQPLGITPEKALPATIAANTIALQKGADILRVHDVREAKHAIDICNLVQQ